MTRAALLPSGGDPFLIAYWLRHYRYWADEVDALHLIVCDAQDDAKPYIEEIIRDAPHASLVEFLPRTDHGQVMRRLIESTDADHVVFLEDDAFVRASGVMDARFDRIESAQADVVGTARGSASQNLVERAAQLWGEGPLTPTGETGLALFPSFVFGARETLAACSEFSAVHWGIGDYIEPLDFTCWDYEAADTFTLASWELRARGLRIDSEAAYRSDRRSGEAPWFHVGSLSAGYGNAFMSSQPPDALARMAEEAGEPGQIIDWQKRMSWWERVSQNWDGCIPEHHERYVAELARFISETHADRSLVDRWRLFYDPLVTWPEA